MNNINFDKISFMYDFIEKFILKDYQGSIDIIHTYLSLQSTDNVIDIGGGTGYISQAVAPHVRSVILFDPSHKMLMKAKKKKISSIQGDANFLPFRKETFEIAILVAVLHHIPYKNQQLILNETRRILKKNGMIFIIEVFHPNKFIANLFKKFENILVGKTYHIIPDTLKYYLIRTGFINVKLEFPKKHNWKYIAYALK